MNDKLLQVNQAASALGVHPNTLRRWTEKGLVTAVRLPSGVRRYRPQDIETIRSGMFTGFPPIEETTLPKIDADPV